MGGGSWMEWKNLCGTEMLEISGEKIWKLPILVAPGSFTSEVRAGQFWCKVTQLWYYLTFHHSSIWIFPPIFKLRFLAAAVFYILSTLSFFLILSIYISGWMMDGLLTSGHFIISSVRPIDRTNCWICSQSAYINYCSVACQALMGSE